MPVQVQSAAAATGRSRREDDRHRDKDSLDDKTPYRLSRRKKNLSKKGDANKTRHEEAPSRKPKRLESRDEVGDDHSTISSDAEERRFAAGGAAYGEDDEAEERFAICSSNDITVECFTIVHSEKDDAKSISSEARSVAISVVDNIASSIASSRSKKKEHSPTNNSAASIDYQDTENNSVDDDDDEGSIMPVKSTPSSASSVASTITNSVISIMSIAKAKRMTKLSRRRKIEARTLRNLRHRRSPTTKTTTTILTMTTTTTTMMQSPRRNPLPGPPERPSLGSRTATHPIRHCGGPMSSIHEEMIMNNNNNHDRDIDDNDDNDDDDIPSTMSEETEAEQ
mmetsp:Transcript_26205/g.56506  ORF Transcript_26205/g.56506 Transcript_26205/m.56506 type:complete len:339 (+) Transcript_26205:219-1235(+)